MRQLYDRFAGLLTAVCSRYVVDPALVKDILQEAFIKAFDNMDRFEFRGEGCLRAWLTRIVVNDSLKALRGRGRLLPLEQLPEPPEESPEDREDPPQVSAEVVQKMILELPDGYRTVFNLFVFEKKSHREIAGLLGIREDSSASQFHRARALLARKIKLYWKEHNK